MINQSLVNKTETTIQIKWVSENVADNIWYSIDNGSTWNDIGIIEASSGEYTILLLASETTYQIKTKIREKDSHDFAISDALSVTTYSYPYANNTPDFTIGSKLTIGLFNPLGRTVNVSILDVNDNPISNDIASGTSISYNTDSLSNLLYMSIPNAQSGIYKVKVTYGSAFTIIAGGVYKVNPNECAPSISGASYEDTNLSIIAITGNNQHVVRNQSVVKYTATGLSAQKSATVSSVSVQVNGTTYPLTISGTSAIGGNAQIDSSKDIEAVFEIIDSRGIKATKTITIDMINWYVPSAIVSVKRQGNYATATDIKANVDFAPVDSHNAITISYSATKEGDSSASVSGTLTNNVTSVINLDNTYAWDVLVSISDTFGGSASYHVFISKGMPIVFFDKDKSSVGINCFPKEQNSLEVNGVSFEKNVMSRYLFANDSNVTANTLTKVALDMTKSVGTKLTAVADGGIQIGSNVSKVLISGAMAVSPSSDGLRQARIKIPAKDTVLAFGCEYMWQSSSDGLITIAPLLVDVEENDIIYLMYYLPSSSDVIYGSTYGIRTYLTIEVVS